MPALRPHILSLYLAVCVPFVAAADNAVIEENYQIIRETDDQEEFYRAAREILALGTGVLPNLTDRLIAAEDDAERIDLTFLLASLLAQSRSTGETVAVPPELVREVAELMTESRELGLEGNLANLAAGIDPQPPEITEGLLSILSRAEHEGLRATTSAVIVMHAEPSALPLIHEALRQSPSDTFSGDIARILHGTDLPDDIAEIVRTLLTSDIPEARQAASRLLDDAGMADPAQLDAALNDLEVATTDMQLLNAAMAVRNHTDGSARVADALENAMTKAGRVEERIEIIRAFGASGAVGHGRFAEIIASANDAEIVRHLMFGALASSELSENQVISEAFITLVATAGDSAVAEEAAFALSRYRDIARPAIETMLAKDDLSPEVRDRLTAILERE